VPGESDEPRFGWRRDPFGLHEARYFSDGEPTQVVRDGSITSYDPPPTAVVAAHATSGESAELPNGQPARPTVPPSHGTWTGPPVGWGWYRDPWGKAAWRWWDGRAWTTWTAPAGADPYIWSAAFRPNASEQRLLRWAKAAVIAYPLTVLAGAITNYALSAQWRRYFHYVHVLVSNPGLVPSGQRPPTPPLWPSVFGPVQCAALIVFMVWIYRAASTAASLQYPARHSPALGAWSCVIPIVNIWFPYQAVRDCLPPGNPTRSLVLRVWLLLVLLTLIVAPSIPVSAYDRSFAVPFLAAWIGVAVLVAVTGYRMVVAVSAAHQEVLKTDG
jgi:hypothetical protein